MHPMQFVLFTVKTACIYVCCACDCVSVCPLSLCLFTPFVGKLAHSTTTKIHRKYTTQKNVCTLGFISAFIGQSERFIFNSDAYLCRRVFFPTHSFQIWVEQLYIYIYVYINFIMQRKMQLNLAQSESIHVDSIQFHILN